MATKEDIVRIALQAVAQRKAGHRKWTMEGQTFDLVTGGWCCRFVRMVHEVAQGLAPHEWRFDAATARDCEGYLKAAGLQVATPQPGDIVGLNDQKYWAGHIAIYLGKVDGVESIAENTSAYRGDPYNPGTKITPLRLVRHELSGYYGAIERVPAEPKLVLMPVKGGEGVVIACAPKWVGQHIAVLGAPVLAAMGLPPVNPAIHASTGYAFINELQGTVPAGWSFTYRNMTQGPRVYIKWEG